MQECRSQPCFHWCFLILKQPPLSSLEMPSLLSEKLVSVSFRTGARQDRDSHQRVWDSNLHIIRLYQDIQAGRLTAPVAKAFLTEEGERLRTGGEDHFCGVRERFNTSPSSLDIPFLNRSCFNGVVRVNRSGTRSAAAQSELEQMAFFEKPSRQFGSQET